MNSGLQDEPGFDEIAGSNPCGRLSMEFLEKSGLLEEDNVLKWVFLARIHICMDSVRSDAVALGWAQGLDEHGVPLDADARASKLAEMELWLQGLVGKFRIEGHRWNKGASSQVLGTADCFGIGSGPGVSCVISANWKPEEAGKGKKPGKVAEAAIRPQILLFGFDPGAMELRVTHVDAIAVELRGFLLDGAVILSERWPPEVEYHTMANFDGLELLASVFNGTYRPPAQTLWRTSLSRLPLDSDGNSTRRLSRIAMKQGGAVDMKFYAFTPGGGIRNQPMEFDLQLHREPQVDANRQWDKPSVLSADFTCAKPAGTGKGRMPDELEESPPASTSIKESGTRQMQAWLGRLVGQYTVEGYIDLCGNGNPEDQRSVTGQLDCIAAGSPPSVHCKVKVSWPPATSGNGAPVLGGVSNLAPAQFLFSVFTLERHKHDFFPIGGADKRGLNLLHLDNRGIAEGAWSELVSDTFMSRENCVDIPGKCYKTTRITAMPDSDEFSMRVDVAMSGKRVLRQIFLLRRETNVQKNEHVSAPLR